MAKPELQYGQSITDWVNRIAPYDASLADDLFEDRAAGFKALEELNLPRNELKIFTPLSTLFVPNLDLGIQEPQDYIRGLNITKFFLSIAPRKRDNSLEKYSKHPLTPENVVPYIVEKVPPELYDQYNLILGEFVGRNAYGGVIVVNPNGQDVRIEMVDGGSSILTRGESPQYVITRDPFTGLFHNSDSLKEQNDVRIGAYKALGAIPYSDQSDGTHIPPRSRKYLPGFYEFNLASLDDGTPLKPLFVDYKDNRANAAYQVF